MSSLLLKLHNLLEGTVVKRPSKIIKSPYVADILIPNTNLEELAHTASLGCCGLSDAGSSILMLPIPKIKNNDNQKCQYKIYLSLFKERSKEIIIGIHPKLAEELTESALKFNYLQTLKNVKNYRRETTIFVEGKVDSRFDFSGIDNNGIPFIMEVKNVPLADYEDITSRERKNRCYDDREQNSKIAYFPDGYRKKTTDTVSPRALKHIKELTIIKKESKTRCIMCYVIQRTDVESFQPSFIDPEYRQACKEALKAGVEIITMVVRWTRDGEAHFIRDNLPINL
jgi:DNA-binding sugar fermentation-stimulating protein